MGGLELRGLMTIGAHVDNETTIRSGFAHLRRTRDQILASGASGTEHCTELSMGMTGDMELAIAEGVDRACGHRDFSMKERLSEASWVLCCAVWLVRLAGITGSCG